MSYSQRKPDACDMLAEALKQMDNLLSGKFDAVQRETDTGCMVCWCKETGFDFRVTGMRRRGS